MKIHLVHSAEPIKQGQITVACGKELKDAQAVYMVDYAQCDIAYSLTGICGKCRKVPERQRYVYGVVNSQEAMLEKSLEV